MRLLCFFLFSFLLISCESKKQELSVGTWRGIIELQGKKLPFNFDVKVDSGKCTVVLKNGAERLLLDEIAVMGDSINIPLHIFDAELRAKIDGGQLNGYFIRNYATDYKFPFHATMGDDFRFVKPGDASIDYSGKYNVRFYSEKDTAVSVGIFAQKGNHVTGTFLLTDGDYRYLEGNVVDGQLNLSTFDGNHAYIFTAIKKGKTLKGDFYAGKSSHQTWTGVFNEKAKMPDPDSLTVLKPGFEKIEFRFPDLNRKLVSLSDEKYKNKVVILQILGTWCPNCMDETRFLAPWYKKNKQRGVEILGLAYERKDDFNYASNRVRIMKKKMNIDYDIVIAGVNDRAKTAATLPALKEFLGFPTTIYIGRDGKVKRIHTGFSGPGTGSYYEEYVDHFNQLIDELVSEGITASQTKKGIL